MERKKIEAIRSDLKDGLNFREIARKHHVSLRDISRIKQEKLPSENEEEVARLQERKAGLESRNKRQHLKRDVLFQELKGLAEGWLEPEETEINSWFQGYTEIPDERESAALVITTHELISRILTRFQKAKEIEDLLPNKAKKLREEGEHWFNRLWEIFPQIHQYFTQSSFN